MRKLIPLVLFSLLFSIQASGTFCFEDLEKLIERRMEPNADVVRLLIPKGEWPRELNRYSDDEPIPHDSKLFIVHVHHKGIVEEIAVGWAKKEDATGLKTLAFQSVEEETEIPATPSDVPQTQIVDGLLFNTVYKGSSWYYTNKLVQFYFDDPVPDADDVEFFFILEYSGNSYPVGDEKTLKVIGYRPELKVDRTMTAWTQDKRTIEILKRDYSSALDMTVDERVRGTIEWHWTLTSEAKRPLGDPERAKLIQTPFAGIDLYNSRYEPVMNRPKRNKAKANPKPPAKDPIVKVKTVGGGAVRMPLSQVNKRRW